MTSFGIRLPVHLSAVFDNTVDHAILLRCLEGEAGIRGCALDWFKSFFMDQTQRTAVEDKLFSLWGSTRHNLIPHVIDVKPLGEITLEQDVISFPSPISLY